MKNGIKQYVINQLPSTLWVDAPLMILIALLPRDEVLPHSLPHLLVQINPLSENCDEHTRDEPHAGTWFASPSQYDEDETISMLGRCSCQPCFRE